MRIYDVLVQDHEKVRQIAAKILDTTERAVRTREKLFESLRVNVLAHSDAEKKVFYPVLKKVDAGVTRDALDEHKEVEKRIRELSRMPKSDARWLDLFEALADDLEAHMRDEEERLFRLAREAIERGDEDRLGREFKGVERKKRQEVRA